MAITIDDFSKIWASTSPLTPYSFSESQYKEGWNFVGSTPPSRQMWDFLQKNNDEKMQYLLTHFDNYLPLSGGTMTGLIQYVDNEKVFAIGNTVTGNVDLGWSYDNREGAGIGLRSTDYSSPGEFTLFARDANNTCSLTGKPGGSLAWDNKEIERVNSSGTNYIRYENGLQIVFDRISVSMSGAESTGTLSSYSNYKYRKAAYYNLPATFVDNNNIAFANANESVNFWLASVNYCNSTQALIRVMGDNNTSNQIISFIAVGRWK